MTTDTELRQMLYDAFASKEANAEMDMFARSSAYLRSRSKELLALYPHKQVVAYGEEIVAVGDSIPEALQILAEKRLPKRGWAMKYFNPNPPVLIV